LPKKNGDTREEGVAVLLQRRFFREEKAPARPNPTHAAGILSDGIREEMPPL
jgi:hypothetical protein